MARWCLLRTSGWFVRGGVRCSEAMGGGWNPSRLMVRCRLCSANSVWIRARSRPETHWPFRTKISSPGRRPVNDKLSDKKQLKQQKPHLSFPYSQIKTFIEGQSIRKHFTDKNPAVFLAINMSGYCKTW